MAWTKATREPKPPGSPRRQDAMVAMMDSPGGTKAVRAAAYNKARLAGAKGLNQAKATREP